MADVLIALGGNLGDVRETFDRAIPMILTAARATLRARSSDYATPAWGDTAQPPFVNACIRIETEFDPHVLLNVLKTIETACGRLRDRKRRWGPRTLDLDIIAFDDINLADADLTLPHPRLFERAFVLVPLVEIAPDRMIAGRNVREALADLSTEGIEQLLDRP